MKLPDLSKVKDKIKITPKPNAADPSRAFGSEIQTEEELSRQTYVPPKPDGPTVSELGKAAITGLKDKFGSLRQTPGGKKQGPAANGPQGQPGDAPPAQGGYQPSWYNPFSGEGDPYAGGGYSGGVSYGYDPNGYYPEDGYYDPNGGYYDPNGFSPGYPEEGYGDPNGYYDPNGGYGDPNGYFDPNGYYTEDGYYGEDYGEFEPPENYYAEGYDGEYPPEGEYDPDAIDPFTGLPYETDENGMPYIPRKKREPLTLEEIKYLAWSGSIILGVILTLFSFVYACVV